MLLVALLLCCLPLLLKLQLSGTNLKQKNECLPALLQNVRQTCRSEPASLV